MSRILNIDTTSESALVNIAVNGAVLFEEANESQRDHASFLHPAIAAVLKKAGLSINDVDAVSVCHGPGSYTGIRVGVAAAKGLCYAAGKPMITVNQLEILTQDAIDNNAIQNGLYCPMIDARRMEVFTAIYDSSLTELMSPAALLLEHHSYHDFLAAGKVFFIGSGVSKWQPLCIHENACYLKIVNKGLAFSKRSHELHQQQRFASLAYSSPLYIKEFYTTAHAR
jgi:tRNA threonylcarbamoyladenosine biosynthesis protein TsaB